MWENYAPTRTWMLTSHESYAIPTVYVRFRDTSDQVYGNYTDDIIYDPVAPSGAVSIGGTDDKVILILVAEDDNSGVDQMLISNDSNLAGTRWEGYAPTREWTLDANRTVYVRYRDRAGNVSPVYSAVEPHWVYLPIILSQNQI